MEKGYLKAVGGYVIAMGRQHGAGPTKSSIMPVTQRDRELEDLNRERKRQGKPWCPSPEVYAAQPPKGGVAKTLPTLEMRSLEIIGISREEMRAEKEEK